MNPATDDVHLLCYTYRMEYKVIALNPPALNGGRFKASQIQKYFDYYAENGWTVTSITSALTRAAFFGFRPQLIITFQRSAGDSDDE